MNDVFLEEINKYENMQINGSFIVRFGNIPVLLSSPHAVQQTKSDGTMKLNEPYTKGINLYVANNVDCHSFVKMMDTGVDPNSLEFEEYKRELINYIKENNIKLVIDIHGASIECNFDIEFGTMNNLSADYSTIKELEDAFVEHGITNITHNNPFKGGGITQYVYQSTDIDVLQIEINKRFRDDNNIENIKSICDAIISFINMYINK